MGKPEIGLSMLYCLNEPFNNLLKNLSKNNVKHVELIDEGLHELNKVRVKRLKETAKNYNLDFVVHAPWAGLNIAVPNSKLRHTILKRLEKSIVFSGQLGCRLWVFVLF